MEESGTVPLCDRNKRQGKGRAPKKAKMAAFFFFAVLVLFFFYVQFFKTIIVIDEHEKKQYYTFTATVGDFLAEKGLQAGVYDKVVPAKEENINSGDTITIMRARPVTLLLDGEARQVWTHAQTVAELLEEQVLQLGEEDRIFPAPGEVLNPGAEVKVVRLIREKIIEREEIPYDTVRVNNPHLDRGVVRVISEGAEGLKENVVELVKKNGEEISRSVVSSRVIAPPVKRVLEYGENSAFSRGGRIFEFKSMLIVEATAYCPGTPGSGCPIDERGASHCTGFHNDGYTFTGVRAIAGDGSLENPRIIAVDPDVIPLKSLVYIEGYGFARAEDTGSAIKKNSIDLLFDQHYEAQMFGRKELKLYILAN